MSPRTRMFLAAGVLLVAAGGGVGAWRWHVQEEAERKAAEEKRFEDIPKEDYERWMQELGYTE